MGLTYQTTANRVLRTHFRRSSPGDFVAALAGNPNTGKSTVFNALTGLKQHTGNWPGKTVIQAYGHCRHRGKVITLVDLPGAYSLWSNSPEEEVARDFICSGQPDVTVVVVDATCLERNLNFVLQVMAITPRVVVCLNLMDEARRKNIHVDAQKLQENLGVPVIPTAARHGEGLEQLKETLYLVACGLIRPEPAANHHENKKEALLPWLAENIQEKRVAHTYAKAEAIASEVVKSAGRGKNWEARIDDLVTSRVFAYPLMLALLGLVFWLTISGANYPSRLLAAFLFALEDKLTAFLTTTGAPPWLHGVAVLGTYRSLAWVVSVMLPPMAIFFPIFTLLEDLGFLPRVAFNLDRAFKRVGAHGKQALTMSMGFGCNAAGVVAARIIDSPRERLIAILTNSFVPCNGKFPTLILLSTIFFCTGESSVRGKAVAVGTVVGLVLTGICITFLVSWLLSATLLKGEPSFFSLELPPYRMPQIGRILIRSFLDRTIFVLGRAVTIAAPAGAITWILANVHIGHLSIIVHLAGNLEPLGRALGLDGVIILAFLLGLPANEIVIPLMLMGYLSAGAMLEVESTAALAEVLLSQGWTWVTALNMMLFSLLHFPCGTTLLTIKKETGSLKWTAFSVGFTTAIASAVCFLVARGARLFNLL